jgi:hypothetical protein
MSEWIEYDGTNPPIYTTRWLQWAATGDNISSPGTWASGALPGLVAWRYLDTDPYAPRPELPEKIWITDNQSDNPNHFHGRYQHREGPDHKHRYINSDIVERDYASKDEWWRYKCALRKARSSLDGRPSNADAIRIINEGLHGTATCTCPADFAIAEWCPVHNPDRVER